MNVSEDRNTYSIRISHVCVVIALAVLTRASSLVALQNNLQNDPDAYLRTAQNLVDFGTYGFGSSTDSAVEPIASRPPLYVLALAVGIALPCSTPFWIISLHLILGVMTVALVLLVGQWLGLERASIVAALIVACDPILLYQSTLVMTETLATFLSVLILVFMTRFSQQTTTLRAGLGGGSFALAALCRPTFLVAMLAGGLLLGVFAKTWRQWLGWFAAYVTATAMILSPWVVRNLIQFNTPIMTTTHGGYTLRLGNNPDFYRFLREGAWGEIWRGQDALIADGEKFNSQHSVRQGGTHPEWDLDQFHYAQAVSHIRDEPGMFAYSCLVRLGRLWQLVPHRIGFSEGVWQRRLRYAVGIGYLAVFALAVAGLWRLGGQLWRTAWVWGLLLCASFTLVHAFYWTNMRMRGPLMPVVALLAAAGLSGLLSREEQHK